MVYFESILLALFMFVFVEAPFNNSFKLALHYLAARSRRSSKVLSSTKNGHTNGKHTEAYRAVKPIDEQKFDEIKLPDNVV